MIYFNELSVPVDSTWELTSGAMQPIAQALFKGLRVVYGLRSELAVAFSAGAWHALCGGRPLSLWMKGWLTPDQYRWLLAKVQNVPMPPEDIEVWCNNRRGFGLALSSVGNSWAFSLAPPNSMWGVPLIDATRYEVGDAGLSENACSVMHISNDAHAHQWRDDIRDWEAVVATDNVVETIEGGFTIEMYPIDHGHPHVHVVHPISMKTVAKFRISPSERMAGEPVWDRFMTRWLLDNQAVLLASWARCKAGGHPFRSDASKGH